MTRILVVDDEPGFRMLLRRYLETGGYQVDEAKNGLDALERMEQRRYDWVLTDVRMPGLNGLQLLFVIRKAWPSIPVVLLSGDLTQEEEDLGRRYGAREILIRSTDVFERLDHALRSSLPRPAFQYAS